MLLLLPLKWCIALFAAAMVHELFHIAAVLCCKGKIESIVIGFGGAKIRADIKGTGKALLCIMSGPVGALILLPFARIMPKTALCALVQSVFNLLPLPFLDGGRALRYILEMVFCKNSLQRCDEGCTIE